MADQQESKGISLSALGDFINRIGIAGAVVFYLLYVSNATMASLAKAVDHLAKADTELRETIVEKLAKSPEADFPPLPPIPVPPSSQSSDTNPSPLHNL